MDQEASERELDAPLRVALLGCGTVGTAVARRLQEHAQDHAARVGRELQIVGIAVRRTDVDRSAVGVPGHLFTADADDLVTRADVVVELIGGIEPARALILSALHHGASVVTANKELLAQDGPALYAAAATQGVDLYFEAAVAGAIPLVHPLRQSLAGDEVHRIVGIVNGTTNYVLDQMDTTGADFDDAVKQAQARGFAEADPSADIEGFDAAAKAAILASLAFHTRVAAHDVHREGICGVTAANVREAREMGCVIKLLAICERTVDASGEIGVSARVHPAMVPRSHPLASVHDAFNAVFIEAAAAGPLMFYGQGAGGDPTASAVLGDVIAVARHRVRGGRGPGESAYADLPLRPIGLALTRYHISLDVDDLPGVLAQVSAIFAERHVSIQSVRQQPHSREPATDCSRASLVVITHPAPDEALSTMVEALTAVPAVRGVNSVMRVEGE